MRRADSHIFDGPSSTYGISKAISMTSTGFCSALGGVLITNAGDQPDHSALVPLSKWYLSPSPQMRTVPNRKLPNLPHRDNQAKSNAFASPVL
jgi:hypothetical protein